MNTLTAPTNRIAEHHYSNESLAQLLQTLLHHYSAVSICQYVDRRIGALMRVAGVELAPTSDAGSSLKLRFRLEQLSDASRSIIVQSLETVLTDMITGDAFAAPTQNRETTGKADPDCGDESSDVEERHDEATDPAISADLTEKVASALAHKMRNSLAAIISAGEQLEESIAQEGATDTALLAGLVLRAANEQRLVLDRFLLAFGPISVRNQRVNLDQHIRSYLAQVRQRLGREIACESQNERLHVNTDPDLLGRIVVELAVNAVEASPHSQPIFCWQTNHGQLVISLSNNGVITPKQMVDEFSQPFVTSKPGHTGLGLYIASRAARELGGSLRILSRSDRTTMAVSLPIEIENLTNIQIERNS